jgi:putative toxin-antitoxin system antitoxin component (TIGR02293 family)
MVSKEAPRVRVRLASFSANVDITISLASGEGSAMTENRDTEHFRQAIRVARIVAHATATFGDRKKADRWLRRPQPRFGERTPMDIAETEFGAQQVEEALVQLDEGYFA